MESERKPLEISEVPATALPPRRSSTTGPSVVDMIFHQRRIRRAEEGRPMPEPRSRNYPLPPR